MGWPRHSCMALDGTIFCSSQPLNAFPREKPQTYKQYHENIYLVNTSLSFPPSLPDSLNFNSFFSLASHPAFFFFFDATFKSPPKTSEILSWPKIPFKNKNSKYPTLVIYSACFHFWGTAPETIFCSQIISKIVLFIALSARDPTISPPLDLIS